MKYIMILLISMLISSLYGCEIRDKNKDISETIAKYLITCEAGTKYGVYDIDNDGIVELFTATNDSHADMVKVLSVDSKAKSVADAGEFGSWGSMIICEKSGFIIDGYTGQGTDETKIYQYRSNTAELIYEMWDNSGEIEGPYEYRINDVLVSEEQYHEFYREYVGDDQVSLGYDSFTEIGSFDDVYNDVYGILQR